MLRKMTLLMVIFIIASLCFIYTSPNWAGDEDEDKIAKIVETAEEPETATEPDKSAPAEKPPIIPVVENPPTGEEVVVSSKITIEEKIVVNNGEEDGKPKAVPIQPPKKQPEENPKPLLRNRLFNSYPNPCNPEVWIPYSLQDAADVGITIYNAKGQSIRTLRLGYKPPDVYISRGKAAFWDGRDDYGLKVASGVYFYALQAGKFLAVKKLLLLK
jgi:hypothetical protein